MNTNRKLEFWGRLGLETRRLAVDIIIGRYKNVGWEFIQSDLSTDLLSEGIFITSRQCAELIGSLVMQGRVAHIPERVYRVI